MRKLCGIVLAVSVFAAPVAWAEPLAAGKPAGVRAAQMTNKEWVVFGTIGAVALGVLIATSGGRSSSAVASQPFSVITTTATSV